MRFGSKVVEKPNLKAKTIATPEQGGFKVGDSVKIVRAAKNQENGWTNVWAKSMNEATGKIGTVVAFEGSDGIQVKVPGISALYFYPEFVLALSKEGFSVGDRVQVKASRMSDNFSLEPATVTGFSLDNNNLLVQIKTDKGRTGGFYPRNIELLPAAPAVKVAISGSKVPSTAFATAQGIAISLAKSNGRVNADEVQDALATKGYSSTDLGNAAGALFRSKNWKKVGAVKSARKGNHARTIQNWKYIGA